MSSQVPPQPAEPPRDQRTPAPSTQPPARAHGDRGAAASGSRSARWVIGGLVAVLALAGLGLFCVAVLPRWWAHRVGDAADGRFSTAIWLGLSLGVVATALPLLLLARALRRHGRGWRRRAVLLVAAVLVAAPNLVTLGIELGNGRAAHAADRTLDVEAPGFRGATLVGSLAAAVLVATLLVLLRSRRRRGEELRRVRAELEEARRAPSGDPVPDGGPRPPQRPAE
ncbi:MAG: hypothetical protein U0Q15_11300 [Kineosporiaceae bacterium]